MTEMVTEEAAASARAAEQARLRKERREAKIKAGGQSRLKSITGLGGGLQREPVTAQDIPRQPTEAQAADPDEVDISQHYSAPKVTAHLPTSPPQQRPEQDSRPSTPQADAVRELLMGMKEPDPSAPSPGPDGTDDDVIKTMVQMLGGQGGSSGLGGPGANPLAGIHNAYPGGMPAAASATKNRIATVFGAVHTVVALALGLYMALFTSFNGTRLQRQQGGLSSNNNHLIHDDDYDNNMDRAGRLLFFYAFATAEAVLLTTRYFIDRGSPGVGAGGRGGVLRTLATILPQPARGKFEMVLDYGRVLGTIRNDVLVCLFVLGCVAWARGG